MEHGEGFVGGGGGRGEGEGVVGEGWRAHYFRVSHGLLTMSHGLLMMSHGLLTMSASEVSRLT